MGQKFLRPSIRLLIAIGIFVIIILIAASSSDNFTGLDFLTYASYVKLGITIVSCITQTWMNFQRAHTTELSIEILLLDFAGGSLSMLQMSWESYNLDDWSSFSGDFTKFALGLNSVLFDLLFALQLYVRYRSVVLSMMYILSVTCINTLEIFELKIQYSF